MHKINEFAPLWGGGGVNGNYMHAADACKTYLFCPSSGCFCFSGCLQAKTDFRGIDLSTLVLVSSKPDRFCKCNKIGRLHNSSKILFSVNSQVLNVS